MHPGADSVSAASVSRIRGRALRGRVKGQICPLIRVEPRIPSSLGEEGILFLFHRKDRVTAADKPIESI